MGGSPVIHLHVNNALKSSLVFCCNSEISSPTTRLLVCTINQAILYSYSLRRAAAPYKVVILQFFTQLGPNINDP
jgi:hypothetical protein